MPRTIWSGAISFGLGTVPINVVSATEDHSVRFHQYHLEDMGRVWVRKFCETEDREVSGDEIGKGYQLTKEHVMSISDDELSSLPSPAHRQGDRASSSSRTPEAVPRDNERSGHV
ncbi:Ku protein [Streptomyces sp. CNZ748]|uniref:Ku protein n=1 Tax=Streptomyces sp. CNZ748 TaxID=2885160 RepID=UPI001E3471FB|nr:Ku protein [Streptomyces sp. CNZ748]